MSEGVAQQGTGIDGWGIHSRAIKTSVTCDAPGQKGSYLFEQSSELPFRPAERVSDLKQGRCGERSSSHQGGSECPRSFEQTRGGVSETMVEQGRLNHTILRDCYA